MKEQKSNSSFNNGKYIQEELIDRCILNISENNSSIWGKVINEKLNQAEGVLREYRYLSISTEKNGRGLHLAQGIWNLSEALEIKERFNNDRPNIADFFSNDDENNEWISFNCDSKVVRYLIANKVFIKDKNTINVEKYKIIYPQLLGSENKDALEINIYPYKSPKENYTLIFMNIVTKRNIQAKGV